MKYISFSLVLVATAHILTAISFVPLYATAKRSYAAANRSCIGDIGCEKGQVCINNQCELLICSQFDKDTACSAMNSTTYCDKDGGKCIPRTAQAGSSCTPGTIDNPCANGFICDAQSSTCIDGKQFIDSFWSKNQSWIIPVLVVGLILVCCVCTCMYWGLKKGVGLASKLFSFPKDRQQESHVMNGSASANKVTTSTVAPPSSTSYPPAPLTSYPPLGSSQSPSFNPPMQPSDSPSSIMYPLQSSHPTHYSPQDQSYPPPSYPPQPQSESKNPLYPPV